MLLGLSHARRALDDALRRVRLHGPLEALDVGEVRVERGAVDAGALHDLLDGEVGEGLVGCQGSEALLDCLARASGTSVKGLGSFCFDDCGVHCGPNLLRVNACVSAARAGRERIAACAWCEPRQGGTPSR